MRICRTLALWVLLCLLIPGSAVAGEFSDNPIVYFVITDRFLNANPDNDRSYGRTPDGEQEIGTFHGGDLAGLTQKLREGYFSALGVNALWITAPYEQIHGWVVGGDKAFRHYSYHGYYALDYTRLDANMGTPEELREFVDTAHALGIRVLFDVVMNHPGYGDPRTLSELGVEVVWDGWEQATLQDYHSYLDYNSKRWVDWWGPEWVRAGLRGYREGDPYDDQTMQLAYLPDFRTEAPAAVSPPTFLRNKADSGVRELADHGVRDYLVSWLSAWVREYGIDGFRCDTVKHVEPESWLALKQAGTEALAAWKAENPDRRIDKAPFWMVGEVFPHGVERSAWFDAGFDSIINFDFQDRAGDIAAIDEVYDSYSERLALGPQPFDVLSYISSHDTRLFDRTRLMTAASTLMLAPGGVQIFYGDETGRAPGPSVPSDEQQATRSDMNWSDLDADLLEHWRRLGQFRARHPAIARGAHRKLGERPYTFSRVRESDRVVVALGAGTGQPIPVAQVFADGQTLVDAYGGGQAVVTDGAVSLEVDPAGVVLLELLHGE